MKYKHLYLVWEVSGYGCDPRGNTSLPIQSFFYLQKNQTEQMIAAQRFEQSRFNAHIHFWAGRHCRTFPACRWVQRGREFAGDAHVTDNATPSRPNTPWRPLTSRWNFPQRRSVQYLLPRHDGNVKLCYRALVKRQWGPSQCGQRGKQVFGSVDDTNRPPTSMQWEHDDEVIRKMLCYTALS